MQRSVVVELYSDKTSALNTEVTSSLGITARYHACSVSARFVPPCWASFGRQLHNCYTITEKIFPHATTSRYKGLIKFFSIGALGNWRKKPKGVPFRRTAFSLVFQVEGCDLPRSRCAGVPVSISQGTDNSSNRLWSDQRKRATIPIFASSIRFSKTPCSKEWARVVRAAAAAAAAPMHLSPPARQPAMVVRSNVGGGGE